MAQLTRKRYPVGLQTFSERCTLSDWRIEREK